MPNVNARIDKDNFGSALACRFEQAFLAFLNRSIEETGVTNLKSFTLAPKLARIRLEHMNEICSLEYAAFEDINFIN